MTSFLSLRPAAVVLVHLLTFAPLHSQDTSQNPPGGAKAAFKDSSQQSASPSEKLLIKDATPIKLKLKRGVYSQYAQVGDEVDYLVDDELVVNGKIVVPEGTILKAKAVPSDPTVRMVRDARTSTLRSTTN